MLNEIRSGTVVAPSSVTLEEYLTEWLTTVRPQLRETTWASYGVAVQRICWGLGARKLQALTAVEVERFYARLVNEGGPAGRPPAARWPPRRSATRTSCCTGRWPTPSDCGW